MRTRAVTALDLRKHRVDVGRGEVVADGGTNDFELLPHWGTRFMTARQLQRLADPLGDGHTTGAGYTLYFPIFGILQNHLEALSHGHESIQLMVMSQDDDRRAKGRQALRSFVIPYRAMNADKKLENSIGTVAMADPYTVGAIAILAYMLGNVLHEGLGHGGACVLAGAKPLVISSVHFECSQEGRLVMAGGTIMNFLAGAVFFVLGRLTGPRYPRLKYFLWICMTVNLYTATGYFLFSGIGGIGDWGDFIQGLGPQWLWRIGLTVFGAATYLLAARISLLELRPLIGSDKEERFRRAVRLSAIPYFAGGILMCVAGSLNPQGAIPILISAAASTFGGTSALMWTPQLLKGGTTIPYGPAAEPMPIHRSWPLIVAACAIAIAFIGVLGPSVRLTR